MQIRHKLWRHQSNSRRCLRKALNFHLDRELILSAARVSLLPWLLVVLGGCASPETRWAEVERSTSAYEKQARASDLDAGAQMLRGYVQKYPRSLHAQQAQDRLEIIVERASFVHAAGSLPALENYLAKYPKGVYAKEARQSLDELREKERLAQEARVRAERAAREQVDARRELEEDRQTRVLGPDDLEKARNVLNRINSFAGKLTQRDFDPTTLAGQFAGGENVDKNPQPVFILDEKSGKLTLRLTESKTREMLLKDVGEIRPNQYTVTFSSAGTSRTDTDYFVALEAKGSRKTIRKRSGDSRDWVDKVTLRAASKSEAAWLRADFETLVKLFSQ